MKKFRFAIISIVVLLFSFPVVAERLPMVPETLWDFARISGTQVSPDGRTVLFTVTTFDVKKNSSARDIYIVPVSGGQPRNISNSPANESNVVWRPDGKRIGFLSSRRGEVQVWEMEPDGANHRQVTSVPGGITGFGYSPDMRHLFFTKRVKVETSPADLHPDLNLSNVLIYDDLMFRHWDRWHDYKFSHIFIAPYNDGAIGEPFNIMENEPWDSPMPPFGGVEQISWLPDGSGLAYVSKKKRGKERALSTDSDIYVFNLETRETTNLTPFNKGYDRDPVFSPDGRYMAWESMETPGFESDKNRIMIMDLSNETYRDFSEGFDQSSSNFRWSANGRNLFFISGIQATYQLYRLNIANGEIAQVTNGWHDYTSLAIAGDYMIGERMSLSSPTEIYRVRIRDGREFQLTDLNRPVLDRIEMGRVAQRWITTTDNKQMLVWVIYPPGFDPNKKYPAILFCGGGPQNAISQFFSYRWNFQLMAAHGYIVIAPNRRGVPTFGQEWNDQISLDYGGQNKQDLLIAAKTLSKEPYIDENRLGAAGASFGGFSVFWLAGHHNGLFRSFIAHCGMFNIESWYATTEEMFFANHDLGGAFWETPRPHSYDFSPHRFVQNWDTPMLIFHGARDYRVPLSEGLQAFNAARLMGVPSRLVVFPEENHWILSPQNSILWQREFFNWFDKWLKE